jgi:hypothetical protein
MSKELARNPMAVMTMVKNHRKRTIQASVRRLLERPLNTTGRLHSKVSKVTGGRIEDRLSRVRSRSLE